MLTEDVSVIICSGSSVITVVAEVASVPERIPGVTTINEYEVVSVIDTVGVPVTVNSPVTGIAPVTNIRESS